MQYHSEEFANDPKPNKAKGSNEDEKSFAKLGEREGDFEK